MRDQKANSFQEKQTPNKTLVGHIFLNHESPKRKFGWHLFGGAIEGRLENFNSVCSWRRIVTEHCRLRIKPYSKSFSLKD